MPSSRIIWRINSRLSGGYTLLSLGRRGRQETKNPLVVRGLSGRWSREELDMVLFKPFGYYNQFLGLHVVNVFDIVAAFVLEIDDAL